MIHVKPKELLIKKKSMYNGSNMKFEIIRNLVYIEESRLDSLHLSKKGLECILLYMRWVVKLNKIKYTCKLQKK